LPQIYLFFKKLYDLILNTAFFMDSNQVDVTLKGVLDVEGSKRWRRITFYAEPTDEPTAIPKTIPDYESVGACWVDVNDLNRIKLRGEFEPKTWFPYIAQGKNVLPLEIPKEHAHVWEDIKF
jgi:hypothetical protein